GLEPLRSRHEALHAPRPSVQIDDALKRKGNADRRLCLPVSYVQIAPPRHHFAGRAHLGPEQRIDACEFIEGKHGFLHGDILRIAACAFPEAPSGQLPHAITTPVERLTGPSTASTPANLVKGNAAAFAAISCGSGSLGGNSNRSPSMTRVAIRARDTPSALLTKGTVREARGFTSKTYSSSPVQANCTFIRPTTFKALASSVTWRTTSSATSAGSLVAGREHALSPECTPASSSCSNMPPTVTRSPSDTAS